MDRLINLSRRRLPYHYPSDLPARSQALINCPLEARIWPECLKRANAQELQIALDWCRKYPVSRKGRTDAILRELIAKGGELKI